MRLISLPLAWGPLVSAALSVSLTAPVCAQDEPSGARADFLAQCASCHGETGDGNGVTELDRPARSFLTGGFSYGNTREALFRSMSYGIPGTPMPAFDEALNEDQRWALADYVISLGPPRTEPKVADRVLRVGDEPLIVRGNMPPVAEGAQGTPRGVLMGLPTGTSFQYRVDDVRLLAVRQGEFVDRVDWTGRGGQALLPLGQITWLNAGGQPAATFVLPGGRPLSTRMRRSSTAGGQARLIYDLIGPAGEMVATVTESPEAVSTAAGAGFLRRFEVEPLGPVGGIRAQILDPRGPIVLQADHGTKKGGAAWTVRDAGDGTFRWTTCDHGSGVSMAEDAVELQLSPGRTLRFAVAMGSAEEADAEVMAALAAAIYSGADETEADYYELQTFTTPDGAVLEVGGMGFLPDGSMAVSTRRGEVWLVDGALGDNVADAEYTMFANGLQEGLGLNVVDGSIYVVQRAELSKLLDEDGNRVSDGIETVNAGWGVSGNYHEFAFGGPVDDEGNFYITLNVSFFASAWWHGRCTVPYRGWCLKVSPEGEMTPVAYGLRSPCGVGRNAAGDYFITDNQGDWVASSPIYHLEEGAFYGHPASLAWTDEYLAEGITPSSEIPPAAATDRKPPAVWIPYKWSRSTGNVAAGPADDSFGPFKDQLFVSEMTNGMVLRAMLEKVRGEYQGAVVPFRTELGSAARMHFAEDGSMMLGYTNRGWGGRSPADGLARLRWTGKVPMEFQHVRLLQDGFEVEFTLPVAGDVQIGPDDVSMIQYDYNYWWEYGSPKQRVQPIDVVRTDISADRRKLTIRTAGLEAAQCVAVVLEGVLADTGQRLLHPEFAYTINQLPEGPLVTELVAKIVPPPPSKENRLQGWLRLCYGDATGLWDAEGWTLCNAELDGDNPKALAISDGNGALVNTGGTPMVSNLVFGDCQVELEFLVPEQGQGAILLAGRYEVPIAAPKDGDPAMKTAAWQGAGVWQKLEATFRAPRIGTSGELIARAELQGLLLNGQLVVESMPFDGPSPSALMAEEAATGPLVLLGDRGPIGFRGVQVKPLAEPKGNAGWEPVFPADSFQDWPSSGDASWELDDEDMLIGTGKMGHIYSPRGDYENFEVRGRFRINDGGNSGFYFRTQASEGWPAGYEAQITSTHPDPQKTGSLYSMSPLNTQLVPPGAWFDYSVRCESLEAGTAITISVNGVVVNEYVDAERTHGPGHIAIQQHHEGSRIEAKDLWIREIE